MSNTGTHAKKAEILLIDGIPWAWTTNHELTSGWWTYDDRQILPGLMVPDLRFALDLERGLVQDEQVTFRILDVDAEILPGFFSGLAKDYKLLLGRLPPTTDPAPANGTDQYGDPLTFHDGTSGCYLGLEAIGPDGERHYYSCWPNELTAGHDHGGGSLDDSPPVYTSWADGPFLVEGRKACLFRIWANDDGTWPSFDPAYRPRWWGTLLQAGGVDGRTWSLQFSGPSSWIQKTLNVKAPSTWFQVQSDLSLDALTNRIYLQFTKIHGTTGTFYSFAGDNTYTVTAGDLDTVVASIDAAITAVKSATGPAGEWTDDDPAVGSEGNIEFKSTYIALWTDKSSGYAANCELGLHWRVWRFLGYDPEFGMGNFDGPQPFFSKRDDAPPGYYFALLTTVPHGTFPLVTDDTDAWDGEGQTKTYNPLYKSSLAVLPGTGQTLVKIADVSGEPIYLESQTIRPPKTSVQIGGQDCNATRWWVFKGLIEKPEIVNGIPTTTEPIETYQVAKCSWVSNDGVMGSIDGLNADLYIESWHDPRLFGFNSEPLDPEMGWAAFNNSVDGGIVCAPLAVWGVWSEVNPATKRGTDKVDAILVRMLTSSGTAVVDPTADDPGDAELLINYPSFSYVTPGTDGGLDVEIADMGLGIPPPLMSSLTITFATVSLPPGLHEAKVAAVGPIQAEDIILGLLGPGDWSMSLAGGGFGLFRRSAPIDPGESTVITISDLAGVAGDPASCIPGLDLRPVQPFDRLTLTHTAHPVDDPVTGQAEMESRARDLGSRARTGVRHRDVAAPYLPARRWWSTTAPVASWELDFKRLWEQDVATWLAKPHRGIRGLRISRPKGQYIYPGQVVTLTLPWPLNTGGSYGITNVLGRVTAVTHEADSCAAVCDILVYADAASRQVWAPIARVVDDVATLEERYDPATRTFHCWSWAEDGDPDYNNVELFAEPDWSSAGGAAYFQVLQYDGTTWDQTCAGFIESVDAAAGTITHTAAGLTGTWYERMYAVICIGPYDNANQVAWPESIFPILGPKAGLPASQKLLP